MCQFAESGEYHVYAAIWDLHLLFLTFFFGGGGSQTGFTSWGGWVLWVAFIKALGFIHRNLTYLSVRRGCQK